MKQHKGGMSFLQGIVVNKVLKGIISCSALPVPQKATNCNPMLQTTSSATTNEVLLVMHVRLPNTSGVMCCSVKNHCRMYWNAPETVFDHVGSARYPQSLGKNKPDRHVLPVETRATKQQVQMAGRSAWHHAACTHTSMQPN